MKNAIVIWILINCFMTVQSQPDPILAFSRKFSPMNQICVSDSILRIVQSNVKSNLLKLEQRGINLKITEAANSVLFDWPTRNVAGIPNLPLIHVQPYFDLESLNPGKVLDFSCGNRSYDGHNGTDIGIWPFMWLKMDEGVMDIIAAASGHIIAIHDGDNDRSCGVSPNIGNYVILQHSDGSRSHYWHMKKGSVLKGDIGSEVTKGEYIGKMGSSGNSSGPHLHFAIESSGGGFVDPHSGICNLQTSKWANQKPYNDPTLHLVTTHAVDNGPLFPPCPQPEIPNIQTKFKPGEIVLFSAYFHDQQPDDVVHHRIIKPDGSIFIAWTQILNEYLQLSLWISSRKLPLNAPDGLWKYEASYYGKTLSTEFTVSQPTPFQDFISTELAVYPNPTTGKITINFGGRTYQSIGIKIMNSLGQKIMESMYHNIAEKNIILEKEKGIYFITITIQKQIKVLKILVL